MDNSGDFQNVTPANQDDFTSLTIVFDAKGSVVKYVPSPNGNVMFNNMPGSLFQIPTGAGARDVRLWDDQIANVGSAGEPGVSALVRFNYEALTALPDDSGNERNTYLDENGKVIALNTLTGQISN